MRVKCADGIFRTFKEIEGIGDSFEVIAFDTENKKLVSSMGRFVGKKQVDKIALVIIDDGFIIECTPDHKFLTSDNQWVEAQDLKNGQSLMAVYSIFEKGYEKIKLTCDKTSWRRGDPTYKPLHRVLYANNNNLDIKSLSNIDGIDYNVHHVDGNKLNNCKDNLKLITKSEHQSGHGKEVYKELGSNRYTKMINDFYTSKKGLDYKEELRKSRISYNKGSHPNLRNDITLETIKSVYKQGITRFTEIATILNCSRAKIVSEIYKHYTSLDDFRSELDSWNHKVLSVEIINRAETVYDITVEKYNNFVLGTGDSSGVIVHNSGKTTACYEMANSALNDYGEDARVVILDSEASTDPARLASFNLFPCNDEIEVLEKDPRVFLHYIATIEESIDTAIKYVNEAKKNNTPTLIIIDSISTLKPKNEVDELNKSLETGKEQKAYSAGMMLSSRIMTSKLTDLLNKMPGSNAAVVLINQATIDMDSYVKKDKPKGG